MPINVYKASGERSCPVCRDGFERLQKLDAAPLTRCPACSAPVRKQISAPNLASSGPSLREDNLERHGFTQYRKAGKGVYEKTAGKGPEVIKKDDDQL
jgi:putative FmdB family regulatory protein